MSSSFLVATNTLETISRDIYTYILSRIYGEQGSLVWGLTDGHLLASACPITLDGEHN